MKTEIVSKSFRSIWDTALLVFNVFVTGASLYLVYQMAITIKDKKDKGDDYSEDLDRAITAAQILGFVVIANFVIWLLAAFKAFMKK